MVDMILFPADYFNINKVDYDMQKEYDAVCATGLYNIVLFDYDKWNNEDVLQLNKEPMKEHTAVYRGWMMKPEKYARFYETLSEHKIRLVTKPKSYELMHVFPNVYNTVKDDSAKMEIYPLHSYINVEHLKNEFQRFMVKDYVKSVKGTEFPSFFDRTITQQKFDEWMELFYKYRGELLTGGICIKEFLDLKHYGNQTNEYRVFYINNEVATVSRNSGQGNYTSLPPKELMERYRVFDSPYYTVDYAELESGRWIIIETGDGSVSGLSDGQDYEQYFRVLYHCFKDDIKPENCICYDRTVPISSELLRMSGEEIESEFQKMFGE